MILTLMVTPCLAAEKSELKSQEDKLSYTIGVDLGSNFKKQGITINPNLVQRGITDGMKGGSLMLTEQEMGDVLKQFQQELLAKRAVKFKELAEKNKTAGEKFLEENKAKKEVQTTSTGLQYKPATTGTGNKPGASDVVTVEYTGKLLNGQEFDSSKKVGKPVTFNLSQVIPGWSEALQLMPEGSVWDVYIPANLGYGAQGAGVIGPNEVLLFNIKLIKVEKAKDAAASAPTEKK